VEVAAAGVHAAVDAEAPTSPTQEKAQLKKHTNTRHEKNRKQPNESW